MGETNIEWADAVWNPVRGCTRVSAGCTNCYAEVMAGRFSDPGRPFHGYAKRTASGARWTGKVELITSQLKLPLHWKKPRRIFVNSMSDLFHEKLGADVVQSVFDVMNSAPQHTYLILTKRSKRMMELVPHLRFPGGMKWLDAPSKNIWLGVSVEDQATADERIPLLLETPAAIRFVSYEPALGPVDFERFMRCPECGYSSEDVRTHMDHGLCKGPGPRLSWVIVGGESGPNARPFDIAWARSTIRQCRDAGAACFVKQFGANPQGDAPPSEYDPATRTTTVQVRQVVTIRDRKGGDMSEWPEDLRVREFPSTRVTALLSQEAGE